MKNLLKVILPPLIGFLILFCAGQLGYDYFTTAGNQVGSATISSLIDFFGYVYILPMLFIVALLTQLLIVVPTWNGSMHKPGVVLLNAIVDLVFVCLIFALGISYAILDRPDGAAYLVKLVAFNTVTQLVYWLINLFVLLLLE